MACIFNYKHRALILNSLLYYTDSSNQGEFGYSNQGFYDFFPGQGGQGGPGPDGMGYPMGVPSPAVPGTPASMQDQPISGPMGTGKFLLYCFIIYSYEIIIPRDSQWTQCF